MFIVLDCVPVAELEICEVQWTSEMRPKLNSWQFSTTLGAMFLRDLYSESTLFPILIQAQDRVGISHYTLLSLALHAYQLKWNSKRS